jgi:hypothetical protein
MSKHSANHDRIDSEKPPKPLLSSADYDLDDLPTVQLPQERRAAVKECAKEIAETWFGTQQDHINGKFGEDATRRLLDAEDPLDVKVRTDGGDGGSDFTHNGLTIDCKTVGRNYVSDPKLIVRASDDLNADYYVLVSRVGPADFRIVGCAPRALVKSVQPIEIQGTWCHVLDRTYLTPLFQP